MQIDLYEITKDSVDSEIYGISIVDQPANGMQFLALSELAEIKLQATDTKKKILTGIVLMPEQRIDRAYDNGTKYQIFFSADTIEKFAIDFFQKNYQRNSTFNHDNQWLSGTTIYESWIVEDPANDKLNALGLSGFPKGTWAVSLKCSDQIWSDYVETGKAKGFSIDSFVSMEKITLSNEFNNKNKQTMKKPSLMSKIIALFAEPITLDTQTSDIGDVTADAFEVGNIAYDADQAPLLDSVFVIGDQVYKTDSTGTIVDVSTFVAEIPVTDEEMAAMDPEKQKCSIDPVTGLEVPEASEVEETEEVDPSIEIQALKDLIASLQAEIEAMKAEKGTEEVAMKALQAEVLELKQTKVSMGLKAERVEVKFEDMTPLQKHRYWKNS